MPTWKHSATALSLAGADVALGPGSRLIPRSAQLFTHFECGAGAINSWVPQPLVTTETGTGTPFALGATGATVAIGVTGGTTNNGEELAGKLVGWNPSTMATYAPLVLEVRAKFVGATTATDGDFYVGFADAVTYTNSLPYVLSAASALTTTVPTEFAGFGYSSIPTSGALYGATGNLVGLITSIAGVDTVTATSVIKDSAYHIYRVQLDISGNAAFYIDGAHVGSVGTAVTANTAFTPYIVAIAKNSHAQTATIDYVFVGGDYV